MDTNIRTLADTSAGLVVADGRIYFASLYDIKVLSCRDGESIVAVVPLGGEKWHPAALLPIESADSQVLPQTAILRILKLIRYVTRGLAMTTKLTLSMDEEVVAAAKRIAKQHGQSVSGMFANMVRAMAAQDERPATEVPPDSVVARLTGIIELPPGVSVDDVRYEAMCEKYGLDAK